MSYRSITVNDKFARDATTIEVSTSGETVTFAVYERYGGDDEGPIRVGITISRAMWERIKATIDQREDAE